MRSFTAALLFVATAAAQDSCATAPERLRGETPVERAWGAQLAADCQFASLAPEIVEQLTHADPDQLARLTWDSEPFWMAHAFLDALVRLRASLDEPALKAIAKGFPTEAIILMLQNPNVNRTSLAEARELLSGPEWIAASNALVTLRADGFASTLLHEVRLSHTFRITETGEIYPPGIAGSIGSGNPTLKVPPGFPPIRFYHLTALPGNGDELISDGTTPIYAQRSVFEPGVERTLTWQPEGHCFQCLRIGYLSQLASLPRTETESAIEPWTGLRWSTQINSEISGTLENQVAALKRLAKSLVLCGALKPTESVLVQIEVRLYDERSDKSQPLPVVGPVKFRLP